MPGHLSERVGRLLYSALETNTAAKCANCACVRPRLYSQGMDSAIIEKEALQLPDAERAILAERLLSSLSQTSQEIRDAWIRESDERLAAFRRGDIEALDGASAIAGFKKRFS